MCRACLTVWRCKSSPNLMEVKGSEAQGRHREVGSEGSAEQNRDLTYRNRIRGQAGRASGQRTAKPISIKGPEGKSGRCAGKTVKLTSGDLRRVRDSGLRAARLLTARQKSAEGVVGGAATEGPNGGMASRTATRTSASGRKQSWCWPSWRREG